MMVWELNGVGPIALSAIALCAGLIGCGSDLELRDDSTSVRDAHVVARAVTDPTPLPNTNAPAVPAPDTSLDGLTRGLDNAQVRLIEPAAIGGDAGIVTVAWRSVRLRAGYRRHATGASLNETAALEAMRFLDELAEADVVLAQSGPRLVTAHDGEITCTVDSDSGANVCRSTSSPTTVHAVRALDLSVPEWMRRPARRGKPPRFPRVRVRPRAQMPPTAGRVASVLDAHPTLAVRGFGLDAAHQLLVVTSDDDFVSRGLLLCFLDIGGADDGETHPVDCTTTPLEAIDSAVATPDGGWLIVAETTYGNPRDVASRLVSLFVGDEGLVVSALDRGGIGGDGEACERHAGYCVYLQATVPIVRLVSPTCVEWKAGSRWSATHVRLGDHWIDERSTLADPQCTVFYEAREGRFVRAACGGAVAGPMCSEDEEPSREVW